MSPLDLNVPTLETERLKLRGIGESDIAWLTQFYADPATASWLGGPSAMGETWRRVASWLGHWLLRGYGPFVIEHKATGKGIGFCALWYPAEFPEIELGWGLAAAHQGNGLATEAAQRVRRYAFQELKLPTLVSYIRPDNLRSRRLAERLGAVIDHERDMDGWRAVVYRHPRLCE
jgi:RimJ/RimL family protein N-acetyltransferase